MTHDHKHPGHSGNPHEQVPPLVQPSMEDITAMIANAQGIGDLGDPVQATPVVPVIPAIAAPEEPTIQFEYQEPPPSPPPALVVDPVPEPVMQTPVTAPVVNAEKVVESDTPTQETDIGVTQPFVPVRRKVTNTVQDYETSFPLTDKEKDQPAMIALPSDTQENTHRYVSSLPNDDIETTVSGTRWMDVLRASRFMTPYYQADNGYREDGPNERPDFSNHEGAWFTDTVERSESSWRQFIESEKGRLGAASPSFSDKGPSNLTGAAAIMRVRHLVGLGSIIQIPLYHSGFWITFKAPSEGAFLELSRRLSEDKIALGRQTYGLAFANTSSFFASQIIGFALAHIHDTTLRPDIDSSEMRGMISSLDIPVIAWGIACVEWPQGFLYARALLGQEEDPNAVIRERLNLRKLLWTDVSALTKWQIAHMADRHGNPMTRESVQRYKNDFTRGKGRDVELAPGLSMTLRVPTMDQYLTSGTKWINDIEMMVNQAFGLAQDPGVRDQYMINQGKATNMRQFAHFIEYISVGDKRISDVETIENMFNELTASDEVRANYFTGIRKFTEDATMTIVAIPISDENDKAELPRFPHLLPLDVLSVFFTLLVQKVDQIEKRQ